MDKRTQINSILVHLKEHGEITSMQAFKLYGCTRLSARIYDLRKRGYVIDSVTTSGFNRYKRPVTYSTYVLEKEQRGILE